MEVKASANNLSLNNTKLKTEVRGTKYQQPERLWIADDVDSRYLRTLQSSTDGDIQEAAKRLDAVAIGGDYDAVIVRAARQQGAAVPRHAGLPRRARREPAEGDGEAGVAPASRRSSDDTPPKSARTSDGRGTGALATRPPFPVVPPRWMMRPRGEVGVAGRVLVPDDDVTALVAHRVPRTFVPGHPLFVEGEPGASVVLVRDGIVKVVRHTAAGRPVLLALRARGELLGEQSALDGGPRSATAVALTRTLAVTVPAAEFVAYLHARPALAVAIAAELSHRLRDADGKRAEQGSVDVSARLAARLVELAERFGRPLGQGEVDVDLPLSQEELAGWVGASREAVAGDLRRMREKGLVATARRRIVVHDLEALRRRSR